MGDCNPAHSPMEMGLQLENLNVVDQCYPYRQVIGKLLYIVIASRPDIAYSIGYLSCFIASYNERHWSAVKRLLCYLKGSHNQAITYHCPSMVCNADLVPIGYCNANWGGNLIDCKSIPASSSPSWVD